MIAPQDKTLIVIETSSFDTEDDMVSMGKDVSLADISESVE